MDGIKYAMTIQNAMLISPETIKENFTDFFLLFRPFDIVSGDFYWYADFEDENNKYSLIACVDCTGHGVAGALMSMIGESLLNQIVYEHEITAAQEIMINLNIGVQEILNQADGNNHHGMDASIMVIDRNEKKVHFSGARQNLLYTENGKITTIKGERLSIGGFADPKKGYKKHVVDYEEGETQFYMFSDGFQDQFGGPDNKKFGANRLTDCLEKNISLPMDKQHEEVEKVLNEWIGKESQTDDIMVMGIKI